MEWQHFLGNFVLGIFNAVACNHVWISIGGGLIFSAKKLPLTLSLSLSLSLSFFLSLHTFFLLSIFLSSIKIFLEYIFSFVQKCILRILKVNFSALIYIIISVSHPITLITLSGTKVHGIVKPSSFAIVVCIAT